MLCKFIYIYKITLYNENVSTEHFNEVKKLETTAAIKWKRKDCSSVFVFERVRSGPREA